MSTPTLTTERLLLRPPRIEDAPAAFERFAGDPVATHYLLWETHACIEDTKAFLTDRIRRTAETGGLRWAICLAGDESMWGSIAAAINGDVAEVGYMLSPKLWGKGLMTEALNAVAGHMQDHNTITRVVALCHIDNRASLRVLEKCQFERQGLRPRASVMPQLGDEPQDCYVYRRIVATLRQASK